MTNHDQNINEQDQDCFSFLFLRHQHILAGKSGGSGLFVAVPEHSGDGDCSETFRHSNTPYRSHCMKPHNKHSNRIENV